MDLPHLFFFFFWIIKNLFPKGQSPTKNTHEVKKDPKKNEKPTAPPLKQRKRGISPKQKTPDKQKPNTHIRAQTNTNNQSNQKIKIQHPHTGTTNKTTKHIPHSPGKQTKPSNKTTSPHPGHRKKTNQELPTGQAKAPMDPTASGPLQCK